MRLCRHTLLLPMFGERIQSGGEQENIRATEPSCGGDPTVRLPDADHCVHTPVPRTARVGEPGAEPGHSTRAMCAVRGPTLVCLREASPLTARSQQGLMCASPAGTAL